MPYVDGTKGGDPMPKGIRSLQEAWDMALENKGIMYDLLYKYVNKHSLPWYKGPDLQAELEGAAWEAFLTACLKFDTNKGFRLSTYAWPAINNALNHKMKTLQRMGGSLHGHYFKGEKVERPELSSLNGLDDTRARQRDLEEANSLSDLKSQAWDQTPREFESELIEKLDSENKISKIKELVELMEEPYREVFTLVYLSPPQREKHSLGGWDTLGGGWSLRDVAAKFGKSREWAKDVHDEAVYWIQRHIDAENDGGE